MQNMIQSTQDHTASIISPQPYMEKQHIIDTVTRYQPTYDEERVYKASLLHFVTQNNLLAHRTNLTGHITGSAWVVDPTYTQALLIHHLKLDKWVQPG